MAEPAYDHVVVVEGNKSYSPMIGNTARASFLDTLAAGGPVFVYDFVIDPSKPTYSSGTRVSHRAESPPPCRTAKA